MEKEIKISNIKLLFILLLSYILLSVLNSQIVLTYDVFVNSYMSLPSDVIHRFYLFEKKFELFTYLLVPIVVVVKLSVLAIMLFSGTLLQGLDCNLKSVFSITIKAEFVNLCYSFAIMLGLWYNKSKIDSQFLTDYYPFSLLYLFKNISIPIYLKEVLRVANIFEVIYIISLSYFLKTETGMSFKYSFYKIFSIYFPLLLLWVTVITFIFTAL